MVTLCVMLKLLVILPVFFSFALPSLSWANLELWRAAEAGLWGEVERILIEDRTADLKFTPAENLHPNVDDLISKAEQLPQSLVQLLHEITADSLPAILENGGVDKGPADQVFSDGSLCELLSRFLDTDSFGRLQMTSKPFYWNSKQFELKYFRDYDELSGFCKQAIVDGESYRLDETKLQDLSLKQRRSLTREMTRLRSLCISQNNLQTQLNRLPPLPAYSRWFSCFDCARSASARGMTVIGLLIVNGIGGGLLWVSGQDLVNGTDAASKSIALAFESGVVLTFDTLALAGIVLNCRVKKDEDTRFRIQERMTEIQAERDEIVERRRDLFLPTLSDPN